MTRDAEGPFFLVHRLVQDVTRRSLTGEGRRRSLVEALGWINAAFSENPSDVRSWQMLSPLAPHALAVTAHADAVGIAEPTARLMGQLAALLHVKALEGEAEPLMRRALSINEENFGPAHPNVSTLLSNLVQILVETNRVAEAEPLMRRALAVSEEHFGPGHPNAAIPLNNLASLLMRAGRFLEAEPLLRRALEIDENSLGANDPNVAVRLSNLGYLLRFTDRFVEAEVYCAER